MKRILIIGVLLLFTCAAWAQQDPMYTQYMFNQLPVNPAYAGSKDKVSIMLLYRNQWVGFDGAPTTTSLTAHGPVAGTRSSFGGTIVHDVIGISNNYYFTGDYAYRIDLGKYRVSMGVSAEFKRQQMKWNNTNPLDQFDSNIPPAADNVNLPNFGGGIYVDADAFYFGVATPRLLENDLDYTNGVASVNSSAKQQRHFFAMAGFIKDLTPTVKMKPAVLAKFTDNAPLEFDLNLSFLFSEKIWLGATYRTGDSFDLIFQVIFDNIRVGYAYDYTLTRLNSYNNGTHEILISVELDNKVKGIYHPRYF